jgi:lipoate---protein ligase
MRLPRHDTLLSLPAADGLRGDEGLLAEVSETPLQRWWVASSTAIVVGLGLRHRLREVVDLAAATSASVPVLERRAGGGAVWLDEHVLCGAVCVPISEISPDVTESYRWLGDVLVRALGGHRVEVDEARADIHGFREACYGALSPHEVVDAGGRKFVGLAQVRRRHAALFQIGILCDDRDQSPLEAFIKLPPGELTRRSVGISATPQQAFAAVSAALDARPCAR